MFKEIKRIVARYFLTAYPDFNENFKTNTDVSNLKLGAVIIQNIKPITLYIIILTAAQTRYTRTEKELLRIVETLK